MDVETLILNLIQMFVIAFGAYKSIRHIKDKGSSVVLIFFVYALLCYFLGDLYYLATEIIRPDVRIPFGVDCIADMGVNLLLASLLNAVFNDKNENVTLEIIHSVIYAIAITILWIVWAGEWTKDILGGIYFGYFLFVGIVSLKKSHAFPKKRRVALNVMAFTVLVMHYITIFVPEDVASYYVNAVYIIMFIGIVWLAIIAVISLVKTIKSDDRDVAKQAVAVGFIMLIWSLNTLYTSDSVMYYIADVACTLALLIIIYAVTSLEEKRPKILVERRANRS